MDSNTSFKSKISKVENLLSIFNNEVDCTIKVLLFVKQQSLEMVESLKKKTSTSAFLKEFLEINSLLLKFLDFLTEINCKFEILQTPGNEKGNSIKFQNSTPTKVTGLKSMNKSGLDFNFKCSQINSIECITNCLSDTSNYNSSDGHEMDKVADKSKLKSKDLKTKKKKSNIYEKESQSSDYYSDKQIICDVLPKTAINGFETVDRKCKGKNKKKYCHSYTQSKEENFEWQPSASEHFEVVKETSSDLISIKIECESEGVSHGLCTKLNDYKNAEVEASRDLNLTLKSSSTKFCAVQQEGCNDKLYEITSLKVSRKIGEEYNVIVEHIISPSEFYVYVLQDHLNEFKELEEKLKVIQKESYLCRKKESKDNLSQVIGRYALYYSKCDEKWCRAKVTDWRLNHKDDLIYIFLLDYGRSKCVTLDDIQQMPDTFKLYPAFVQRCHLSGLFPAEFNSSSKTLSWSKAAIEKMKCLVDTSEKLKIKIEPEDTYHPAKSLPVTIWFVDDTGDCINELLIKSQHAQLMKKPKTLKIHDYEVENLEKWNPMKEDFESNLNCYDLDMKDPAAIIYGYIGKDYDRVCKHFAKTGKCFKGDSCKKEHVPLNSSGFTTDKEEVYKNAVNPLPLPPPSSIIGVQLTCILDANIFCCIRDESPWASEEETLQSLVAYMNTAESIRDMQKLLIPPSVGQIVIARYSQDYSWYRAKIIESQPESDQFGVLFVDYGNKESMPLCNIRAIEGRYLHLPFQAMECCVFGITRNPRVPVKDCMDYLNKRLTEGHISLEIVATFPGDHPRLLVHVFDQNGKSIGTDLIENNYAVLKEELIVNNESTLIPG